MPLTTFCECGNRQGWPLAATIKDQGALLGHLLFRLEKSLLSAPANRLRQARRSPEEEDRRQCAAKVAPPSGVRLARQLRLLLPRCHDSDKTKPRLSSCGAGPGGRACRCALPPTRRASESVCRGRPTSRLPEATGAATAVFPRPSWTRSSHLRLPYNCLRCRRWTIPAGPPANDGGVGAAVTVTAASGSPSTGQPLRTEGAEV